MSKLLVRYLCVLTLGSGVLAIPTAALAAPPPTTNPDCTLIVPAAPLSAGGLATPYQLEATNPINGPCHETDPNQDAFVEAAIINLLTGEISIYHPLVIDAGSSAAIPPVAPVLPPLNVVAIWFGSNADGTLTLQGATPMTLGSADCHQGMGQFAYCNAGAFFAAANTDILIGLLNPPPLGVGTDGQPCPTTRSFMVVDQDQSDNLPTSYIKALSGKLAQDTAANRAALPGWTPVTNGSDERLLEASIDPALGCLPWKARSLDDPTATVSALALNELHAAAHRAEPVALVPLGDPFVANTLSKVSEYRMGVDQIPAFLPFLASTTTYCQNLRAVAVSRLNIAKPKFIVAPSPKPLIANSLFTFLGSRLSDSYNNLGCMALINQPNPVSNVQVVGGVIVSLTIN
jgi:hypothetical protein